MILDARASSRSDFFSQSWIGNHAADRFGDRRNKSCTIDMRGLSLRVGTRVSPALWFRTRISQY